MPRPKNQKEVKQFLGLIGYYRKSVPRFADISRVLNKLTRMHYTQMLPNMHMCRTVKIGGAFTFFFGICLTVNPLMVGTGMRYGKPHNALQITSLLQNDIMSTESHIKSLLHMNFFSKHLNH